VNELDISSGQNLPIFSRISGTVKKSLLKQVVFPFKIPKNLSDGDSFRNLSLSNNQKSWRIKWSKIFKRKLSKNILERTILNFFLYFSENESDRTNLLNELTKVFDKVSANMHFEKLDIRIFFTAKFGQEIFEMKIIEIDSLGQ